MAHENLQNHFIISNFNGIATILQSTQQHEQCAEVQEWGYTALEQLVCGNSENQPKSADGDCVSMILQATQRHEFHEKVSIVGMLCTCTASL